MNDYTVAFLLTVLAGLSMLIGSGITVLTKLTNKKFLSISLGFSAGVMIYLSMMEILPEAREYLDTASGEFKGGLFTLAAFFGGIFLMWFLEAVVAPHDHGHGCGFHSESHGRSSHDPSKLMRIGQLTAIALAIHNFPEGLTTFVSALQGLEIAIPIVVAIIIHNIPAGISISSPISPATGSRTKAMKYTFLSGLAEPAGALAGWLILVPFMSDMVFGVLYAGIAGVMIFMSFDELLPSAREYGSHKFSIYGLVLGMAVMAVSLLFL